MGRRGEGKKGQGGRRGSRRVDGYDGSAGSGRDVQCYEGYGARRRDRASYRGDGRSEISEGLDRRRTIMGELSGRY